MPGAWPLSCGLLAACVWLRAGAAARPGPRPLGEFGQQLERAAGGWSPEAGGWSPGAGASARCQSAFGLMQDHIIRTRDSLDAGASFLNAPADISSPALCLRACCAFPGCTVAVVERGGLHWARGLEADNRPPAALSCYLFNCTVRGRNVCRFSAHRGYSSFTWGPRPNHHGNVNDEAPHCDAGQDVALLLPTNWVLLDGRGSADDQGIVRYEWTLLQGDPSVDMKSPQPGMLKLSGLREGVYMIQLSVTDTIGQKSNDNVTITVMPPKHQTTGRRGGASNGGQFSSGITGNTCRPLTSDPQTRTHDTRV